MKKDIAVLGLGIFGFRIATELSRKGHNVLAVDRDKTVVEQIKDNVTEAVIADVTDHGTLTELGIEKFDIVIIGIGSSFEQALLTLADLKKTGCKHVIAKANRKVHEELLLKIGADEVILPEREVAKRLADRISRPDMMEILTVDGEVSLINVAIPARMEGKSLLELDLRKEYQINAVMVKKNGSKTSIITNPNMVLHEGDELIVAGKEEDIIKAFAK
ncbi:MAG: TrkA family potassium uptake protein [Deferribacterales bacterium]